YGIDIAAQATARFEHGRRFVVTDLHFGHAGAPLERQHGHCLARDFHEVREHAMAVQHGDFNLRVRLLSAPQILVDSSRDSLSVSNAVDDQAGAKNTIAAGEDTWRGSRKRPWIGHDETAGAG